MSETGDPSLEASGNARRLDSDMTGHERIPTVGLLGGPGLVHEGLRLLLREHGIKVVGSYRSEQEMLQSMQGAGGNGWDAALIILGNSGPFSLFRSIRQLLGPEPKTPLIVLSEKTSRALVQNALRSGARGYVDLDVSPEELVDAISTVAGGKVYLSSAAAGLIASDIYSGSNVSGNGRRTKLQLSPREVEIVQLLCEGRISREIASQLHISAKTVENHRYNIYRKCDVDNIAGLVRHAIQNGMVTV